MGTDLSAINSPEVETEISKTSLFASTKTSTLPLLDANLLNSIRAITNANTPAVIKIFFTFGLILQYF